MKLDLKQIAKAKPNPIFKGLPSRLKDPKNFKKTEKKLREILKSDHKHKKIKEYINCVECKARLEERRKLMKVTGFKGINQYLEWKKVMDIIINKRDFQVR